MSAQATRSLLVAACLILTVSAAPGAQSVADYQALRKEMDLLRERIVALQKEVDTLKGARPVAVAPSPAASKAAPSSPIVPVDNVVLNLAQAPMRGSSAAKVVMVEVSDFECPFCGRYARDTSGQLAKQYVDTGKVRQAFVHLPLAIHRFALKAGEAAACAADQGKFWEMHDLLFSKQGSALAPAFLPGKGEALGLNQSLYTGCLDSAKHAAYIQSDMAMVQKYGITGTPAFFIGTMDPKTRVMKAAVRIVGAKPLAIFQQALDELLAKAESGALQ